MRYCLDYVTAQPFTEFHPPLLMTRRAEMPALARKCQQIFMAAVIASDAGKTATQVTTIQVTLDYLTDIRAKKSILSLKALYVNLLKWFKVVFNTLKIKRIPRIARPVNITKCGHGFVLFEAAVKGMVSDERF
jgi:hypothetical protein